LQKSKKLLGMEMLVNARDATLFAYFKSLEMGNKKMTPMLQDLASQVWDDMVDFVMINDGDVGILIEAGLEVIINTSIEDEMEKG